MAIKSSLKKQTTRRLCKNVASFMAIALFLYCPCSYAKKGPSYFKIDRNITSETFLTLSARCFPFDLSKAPLPYILKQFHFYWGTKEGRRHTLLSLKNLRPLISMIDREFQLAQLPSFLKAIPIVETGYTNYRPKKNSRSGAGIWMMTKDTARFLGLEVNKNIDERRNIEKETKAAVKLLSSHYEQLQDWFLVLLAYNRGAYAVAQSTKKLKSSDPWAHIQNHHENDPGYLAKIISTAILINCPELLE